MKKIAARRDDIVDDVTDEYGISDNDFPDEIFEDGNGTDVDANAAATDAIDDGVLSGSIGAGETIDDEVISANTVSDDNIDDDDVGESFSVADDNANDDDAVISVATSNATDVEDDDDDDDADDADGKVKNQHHHVKLSCIKLRL
ncbi:hypothetical protein AWC38_SpisGene22561 [Stylophora pistillata]|uniref:Uncharacterized protein n=1 Tax=Stylophora pistillata TaxID=50429 RepID=A0A2B4R889_STYPI|nr:hypothetical protein AWC38_SpisGene22561 [Stylophora pistillata]